MILRLASLEDEEKISVLIAQFRIELKLLKGITSSVNIEHAKEEFKEYVEAKYPIYVAEDETNELLGYLVCRIDNNVVWAESLFVSREARREGVATRLYREAENMAKKRYNSTLFNWIHPNNDKMILFLANMGYNVLNLIEIRKPWENEITSKKITIGNHEYEY